MKTIITLIALTLICISCSWTKAEKTKEACWLFLHGVDYKLTQYAMERPDEFKELNPLLGDHPSEGRLNTCALVGAALHIFISDYFDTENRSLWQDITLGLKLFCVGNNFYVGAKIEF